MTKKRTVHDPSEMTTFEIKKTAETIIASCKTSLASLAAHADWLAKIHPTNTLGKLHAAEDCLAELWSIVEADDRQSAYSAIVKKISYADDRIRTPLGSEWRPEGDNTGCISWSRVQDAVANPEPDDELDAIVIWATPGWEVPDDVIAVQVGTYDGDVYSLNEEPYPEVQMAAVTKEAYLATMLEVLTYIEVALARGQFGEDARRPVPSAQDKARLRLKELPDKISLKELPVHVIKGYNDPEPKKKESDELPDPEPERVVTTPEHLQEIIAARVKAARVQHSRKTDELGSIVAGRIQAAITDCIAGILEDEERLKQHDSFDLVENLAKSIGATLEEYGIEKDGGAWADEAVDVDLHSPSDEGGHESLGGQDSYRDEEGGQQP